MPNPVKTRRRGRNGRGCSVEVGLTVPLRQCCRSAEHRRGSPRTLAEARLKTLSGWPQYRDALHGAGTMKAAVLHGREDIRIERYRFPSRAGELIVRVGAALTCGTDLKVFRRGYHARMIVPSGAFWPRARGNRRRGGRGSHGFRFRRPCGGAQFRALRPLLFLRARPGKPLRRSAL